MEGRDLLEFLCEKVSPTLWGLSSEYEDSKVVVVGVPFDATSSFRPGSRFAPRRIREISEELETYLPELDVGIDELPVFDGGDLGLSVTAASMLESLTRLVKALASDDKVVALIGGEHTITLGAIKGLTSAGLKPSVLILDAHLDFRDEYPEGERLTHATVTRRVAELVGPEKVIVAGVRAISREEYLAAKETGVKVLQHNPLNADSLVETISDLLLEVHEPLYISLDMDVVDPSHAPGVSNPEPLGLSPASLLKLLREVAKSVETCGVDLVEVNPLYDVGDITSALAAKVLGILLAWICRR